MAFIWIYGTLFTTAFEAHIPVIYVENSRKEMSEWLTFNFCGCNDCVAVVMLMELVIKLGY